MAEVLSPAVVAEDLRALADVLPFDRATKDLLLRAADLIDPDDDAHAYLSTACHHRRHDECRLTCKFCPTACGCSCHA